MSNSLSPSPIQKGYFNYIRREYGIEEAIRYKAGKVKTSLNNLSEDLQALAVIGMVSFYESLIEPFQMREKESRLIIK